jgi:uncharacterized membrane protein YgdD (TMEM256/DUF423 family)
VIRLWICTGAANGFVAVALGAFATHFLDKQLSKEAIGWIATGARYELFHAVALLSVAWLAGREVRSPVSLSVAGWSFLLGSVLFCGTLYLMALTGVTGIGRVVPIGGVAFLFGWGSLFFYGLALRW